MAHNKRITNSAVKLFHGAESNERITNSAVELFHGAESIVAILEMHEAVVLDLLDALHLPKLLELLPQLVLSHIRLEVRTYNTFTYSTQMTC